jgi:hypothetical protein
MPLTTPPAKAVLYMIDRSGQSTDFTYKVPLKPPLSGLISCCAAARG